MFLYIRFYHFILFPSTKRNIIIIIIIIYFIITFLSFYFILFPQHKKRNYIIFIIIIIINSSGILQQKNFAPNIIIYYIIQYITFIILWWLLIFAPWLLPLTFSWHRGIKVSEICIFQIRRCVLCLHVPWCMFSHLFHVCCPSCPNKEPRLGPIPPRASRAPPDFLTSLPPAFLLSLSPPLSSTLFSHRYLIPLLPSYICLSPLASFLPRLVVFSFALLHLWLLQVFSVCHCGALWEWLNHHTQSVWHGARVRLHTSLPNAANGMN